MMVTFTNSTNAWAAGIPLDQGPTAVFRLPPVERQEGARR